MNAPTWLLSIPLGFAWTLFMRVLSVVLQEKSGVPLLNQLGREQALSKEVAMKDTNG